MFFLQSIFQGFHFYYYVIHRVRAHCVVLWTIDTRRPWVVMYLGLLPRGSSGEGREEVLTPVQLKQVIIPTCTLSSSQGVLSLKPRLMHTLQGTPAKLEASTVSQTLKSQGDGVWTQALESSDSGMYPSLLPLRPLPRIFFPLLRINCSASWAGNEFLAVYCGQILKWSQCSSKGWISWCLFINSWGTL